MAPSHLSAAATPPHEDGNTPTRTCRPIIHTFIDRRYRSRSCTPLVPDFRIHQIRWALTLEDSKEIVCSHHTHLEPCLMRGARNVWSKDDLLQFEQFRFDIWLSFENVDPGASNLSFSHSAD